MDIKSDIIKFHIPFFERNGFTLNSCSAVFEKVYEGGKQVVEIQFHEENDGLFLEYCLGVHINSIEELVNQYLPILINNVEDSLTLCVTMDKLGNFFPAKVKIPTHCVPTDLINQIENFFSTIGFDWLDWISNPLILEQEYFYRVDTYQNSAKMVEAASRSIALSKLYKPENYPVLRKLYLEKMDYREMTPLTLASFFHFLNFLDNLKPVAA